MVSAGKGAVIYLLLLSPYVHDSLVTSHCPQVGLTLVSQLKSLYLGNGFLMQRHVPYGDGKFLTIDDHTEHRVLAVYWLF